MTNGAEALASRPGPRAAREGERQPPSFSHSATSPRSDRRVGEQRTRSLPRRRRTVFPGRPSALRAPGATPSAEVDLPGVDLPGAGRKDDRGRQGGNPRPGGSTWTRSPSRRGWPGWGLFEVGGGNAVGGARVSTTTTGHPLQLPPPGRLVLAAQPAPRRTNAGAGAWASAPLLLEDPLYAPLVRTGSLTGVAHERYGSVPGVGRGPSPVVPWKDPVPAPPGREVPRAGLGRSSKCVAAGLLKVAGRGRREQSVLDYFDGARPCSGDLHRQDLGVKGA